MTKVNDNELALVQIFGKRLKDDHPSLSVVIGDRAFWPQLHYGKFWWSELRGPCNEPAAVWAKHQFDENPLPLEDGLALLAKVPLGRPDTMRAAGVPEFLCEIIESLRR